MHFYTFPQDGDAIGLKGHTLRTAEEDYLKQGKKKKTKLDKLCTFKYLPKSITGSGQGAIQGINISG